MVMKQCSTCKVSKPFNDFYRDKTKSDGYAYCCKPCKKKNPRNKEKAKARYEKWRESDKGRVYFKAYYQQHKDLYYERNKKWCEENRERYQELWRKHANKESTKKRHRFQEAKRRAQKLKATPQWADMDRIREIYENCPKGHHVDHCIPLNNPIVCGLHVENNLQYLPALENIKKNNKLEEQYV